MSGWVANEQDHTFRTGRTFRIRRGIPLQWLMSQALDQGDDAAASLLGLLMQRGAEGKGVDPAAMREHGLDVRTALALERHIVEAMWIRPRVVWHADVVDAQVGPDGVPEVIAGADLADDEIAETVEIALGGVADATRFPGLADSSAAGADRPRVGKGTKRAARPSRGKP